MHLKMKLSGTHPADCVPYNQMLKYPSIILGSLVSVIWFEDDTNIFVKNDTPFKVETSAQQVLSRTKDWFTESKYSVKESKTQEMKCSMECSIVLNSLSEVKPQALFLVLKLIYHFNNVCTILARILHILRRLCNPPLALT